MRLPRLRVTVRRLMVGVAVVAAILALVIPVLRTWQWSHREWAAIESLDTKARSLGGSASVPPGAADAWGGKIQVVLDLEGTATDDTQFYRLAGMPAFEHVEIMSLANTKITDQSLRLLEGKPLYLLNLTGTKVTDKGLRSLAKMPWLTSLDLSGTAVTDDGMDVLAGRAGLWDLRSLDLKGTRVTERGVRKLSESYDFLVIEHPVAVHPMSNKY